MKTEFVVCDTCFHKIAQQSTACAKLWIDLCEVDFKNGIFSIRGDDFPALRMLELMGYLTTTDHLFHLVIKVNGRGYVDNQTFYCCCEENNG